MTKVHFFIIILFLITLPFHYSCKPNSVNSNEQPTQASSIENNPILKPGSSNQDTITIQTPVAVFYYPDSLQLENIKKTTSLQNFDGLMHEFEYQIKFCTRLLKTDWPQLPIHEVRNYRYIQFTQTSGESIVLDLNEQGDPIGLFIANGKKTPVWIDMPNISQLIAMAMQ